jgi:exoribonuclease-2
VLVEFMERGGLVCGWVLNPSGARGRLEVRMEGGRAIGLAPARILTSTELPPPKGEAAMDELVSSVAKRREALAAQVDLEALWESLEGEGPEFSFPLLAGLNFGREAGGDDVSALIRAVHADGLLFEFSPQSARRRSAEEIEKAKSVRAREEAKKAAKENGAAWIRGSLALEAQGGGPAGRPSEAEAVAALMKGLLLEADDFKDAGRAKEILRLAGLPPDSYGAFQALIAVGEASADDHVELSRLGRPLGFSPELLEEARGIAAGFEAASERRLDLTSLFTATVDAPGAKEFDDAISLEASPDGGKVLWLHIADPAALVAKGAPLDEAASLRAATVYLPEGRHPMLPDVLTEKVMSLAKGRAAPAFSLRVALSPEGAPLEASFSPSLVSVDLQLSFPEAEAKLSQEGERCVLRPFLALAKVLAERRLSLGGQNLKLPRGNASLDANGLPLVCLVDEESQAGLMVEEMMILANHLAAKTLSEAGWPCPYRYQDKSLPRAWAPPPEAPARVRLASDLAARRLVGRGGITLEPSAHHGVGLGVYTSFTSPMRRYLDLAVARQLRALVSGGAPAYDKESMMLLAKGFEADYRAIRRLQNNRQRYWAIRLLSGKTGERFVGLVFERKGRRAKVCLTDYMLELELPFLPPDAEPGKDVLLRLSAAEPQVLDRRESLVFEYLQTL